MTIGEHVRVTWHDSSGDKDSVARTDRQRKIASDLSENFKEHLHCLRCSAVLVRVCGGKNFSGGSLWPVLTM